MISVELKHHPEEWFFLHNFDIDKAVSYTHLVLELQTAHAVGDALNGILNGVCEVVHRVDAPLAALTVMLGVLCLLYTSPPAAFGPTATRTKSPFWTCVSWASTSAV